MAANISTNILWKATVIVFGILLADSVTKVMGNEKGIDKEWLVAVSAFGIVPVIDYIFTLNGR
jgi:hypothetical protein